MEGDTTFEDVKDALDGDNLPNEIPGRILEPYMLIQDVNVADGEHLVLEWKIGVRDDSEQPYCYDPKPNAKRKAFTKETKLPEEFQQVEN